MSNEQQNTMVETIVETRHALSLQPALRFPEFQDSGEWEVNVLSKITKAIFDGTHQTPTYTKDGIPFFSVENLVSGNKNKFISLQDYELATIKNKPEKDDILITRIGKIGFSAIVDWDYKFSIYVTLACIKKSPQFNSYYLHYFFQSDFYQKEILSRSLLNAVPCKINMNELRETTVLLPSLLEQRKIADCLSSLDALITAEGEKLEALKAHKKGLMQNLFPAEGETVPRLRFPEFQDSGEWEEKTLGEILEFKNGINASKEQYGKGVKFINVLDILQNEFITYEKIIGSVDVSQEMIGKFSVNYGDILFQRSSETQEEVGTANVYLDKQQTATFGGFVIRGRKIGNYEPIFLNKLLKSESIRKSIYSKSGGSTRFNIGQEILMSIQILLPSLPEQRKIADCLSSLDALIMAQGEKIALLKQHKKGLMQVLFP